jgi:hypothetical protein
VCECMYEKMKKEVVEINLIHHYDKTFLRKKMLVGKRRENEIRKSLDNFERIKLRFLCRGQKIASILGTLKHI